MKNPFSFSGIVKDTAFCNRKKELADLKKYIKKAIELGCNKFNIGLIFRKKFVNGIQKTVSNPPKQDSMSSYLFIEKILNEAKYEMKNEVIHWMQLLGSAGKG